MVQILKGLNKLIMPIYDSNKSFPGDLYEVWQVLQDTREYIDSLPADTQSAINSAAAITTPADADVMPINVSSILKKVTWANIKAALKTYFDGLYAPILPAGSIQMYGGSSAPTGWALCNGSLLNRTTYATLFTAIGTTFGAGDGSTTFKIPDMRGVFAKGAGTTDRAAGKDASGNFYAGGSLGAYATDQMQGHQHAGTISANSVYAANQYPMPATGKGGTAPSDVIGNPTAASNGTPRTGATTEPQSLALNYIIKL